MKLHIGETGRCFETRLKEHKRDNNSKNLAKLNDQNLHKKTALVKHSFTNEHKIDFKNAKVLQFQTDFIKRRFLESWFINFTNNTMNDKDIQSFPQIYNTIKKIKIHIAIILSSTFSVSIFPLRMSFATLGFKPLLLKDM